MALVRLANLKDYESVEVLGRTMFKITWCPTLCPGNPTDDPVKGLDLYNEYQCSVAAGLEHKTQPAEKLALIVEWCLAAPGQACIGLAKELLAANRNGVRLGLNFPHDQYAEPALAYRYELAFLNDEIQLLPAAQVMQLQNLVQVAKYD